MNAEDEKNKDLDVQKSSCTKPDVQLIILRQTLIFLSKFFTNFVHYIFTYLANCPSYLAIFLTIEHENQQLTRMTVVTLKL